MLCRLDFSGSGRKSKSKGSTLSAPLPSEKSGEDSDAFDGERSKRKAEKVKKHPKKSKDKKSKDKKSKDKKSKVVVSDSDDSDDAEPSAPVPEVQFDPAHQTSSDDSDGPEDAEVEKPSNSRKKAENRATG